jgi:hypothetical protein
MNISHIDNSEILIPGNEAEMLAGIFNRQKELHEKYKGVEGKNRIGLALVEGLPFHLDDPKWQYIIKDFAWRVSEELTEALEAQNDNNHLHCMEEIIDALHFYTELLLLCGYESSDIDKFWDKELDEGILTPIYNIGLACNLLKNKPWKSTHLITDHKRFDYYILEGYRVLLYLAIQSGLGSMEGIFIIYMKKSMVNKFRMESNY